MELTKENLINLIKEYSVPEFTDLNIYSMPYFHNVLVNFYENRDCNVVYSDFNKVNDANLKYGEKATDEILKNSLSCIRESFPNSDIVRIGGDEFLLIDENLSTDEINEKFEALIKNDLNEEGKTLPLTFAAVHHKKEDSFYDSYSNSELLVDQIKLENKIISTDNYEDILKFKMHENFKDFFDNFRFSKYFKFTNKNVQTLGSTAVDSAISLLIDKDYAKQVYEKSNNSQNYTASSSTLFTPEEAEIMHDILSGKNTNPELLDKLSLNTLDSFMNNLIRNPLTGFYNKAYFNKFFKDNASNIDYATILKADVTGIKNCNTKYSHLDTDVMITDLSKTLKSCFSDNLNIEFNDENFEFNKDGNYLFDMGGGNFIVLLKDHDLSFEEYIAGFDSISKSAKELGIVSSYTNTSFSLEEAINRLNFDCDSKKSAHKKNELKSEVSKDTLDLFISDCVNYYLTNSENPDDLANQQKFLSDLFDSVVDNAIEAGKKYELSKEAKENEIYHEK